MQEALIYVPAVTISQVLEYVNKRVILGVRAFVRMLLRKISNLLSRYAPDVQTLCKWGLVCREFQQIARQRMPNLNFQDPYVQMFVIVAIVIFFIFSKHRELHNYPLFS